MHMVRRWDIFCRVIDNHGDIGVCWRLAANLAARGHLARLWVDDGRALTWMAPGALEGHWAGVEVRDWALAGDPATLTSLPPADVWIEAFGCDIPTTFLADRLASRPGQRKATWINLEYLSAETFAERTHGLPSPVMQGVAKGCTKYFYYPGLTPGSGGLLREHDLVARHRRFDRPSWLAKHGIPWQGERLVSLFCYEPAALAQLLRQLREDQRPTRLLVTHGRATAAVQALCERQPADKHNGNRVAIDFLPPLTQSDFDHLLWSCDLNFVRGEDSLVRAIWAGKALVWQIYPQHDNAHHAKLQAWLDGLQSPASLRQAHAVWNALGGDATAPEQALPLDLAVWTECVDRARQRLVDQTDLCTRLQDFVNGVLDRPFGSRENG